MPSNGGACFSESEVAWPTGAAKRRSFREHYKERNQVLGHHSCGPLGNHGASSRRILTSSRSSRARPASLTRVEHAPGSIPRENRSAPGTQATRSTRETPHEFGRLLLDALQSMAKWALPQ